MTINKTQGPQLNVAGLHLNAQCFRMTHLNIILLRVTSKRNLTNFVLASETLNIV